MDLTAMIAALKAGKLDDVLAGTKYVVEISCLDDVAPFVSKGRCMDDAKENAARVIVLEAALRESVNALKVFKHCFHTPGMSGDLHNSPQGWDNGRLTKARQDTIKLLTVTATLIEWGE